MFYNLNMITKKQISLIIILVIFLSCISVITHDTDKDFGRFNINEKLSNNVVDVYYEMLVLQYNIVENKCRERNVKINYNDRIAILFIFFAANNIDRLIKISNRKSISEINLIQDTILLFIHNKDGKKQLI